MLPNSPQFVIRELETALEHNVRDYWIINCSNVKPHTYFLDLIAQMWCEGKVDVPQHREQYVSLYYGKENKEAVAASLADYPKYALAYGEHEDDHAGEQFSNHPARILITQYIRDKNTRAQELLWASDGKTLKDQILWYGGLCQKAALNYEEYLLECERTDSLLTKEARRLYRDSLMLQAKIHYHCFSGAYHTCSGLLKALDEEYKGAFYEAGLARNEYIKADRSNSIYKSADRIFPIPSFSCFMGDPAIIWHTIPIIGRLIWNGIILSSTGISVAAEILITAIKTPKSPLWIYCCRT